MRLIDADALKELFPDNGEGSWTYNVTVKACNDAQLTIDAEIVTHGKWIVCDEEKWEHNYALRCSECNGGYHLNHEDTITWMYCPQCGARMDEE